MHSLARQSPPRAVRRRLAPSREQPSTRRTSVRGATREWCGARAPTKSRSLRRIASQGVDPRRDALVPLEGALVVGLLWRLGGDVRLERARARKQRRTDGTGRRGRDVRLGLRQRRVARRQQRANRPHKHPTPIDACILRRPGQPLYVDLRRRWPPPRESLCMHLRLGRALERPVCPGDLDERRLVRVARAGA